MDPATNRAAKAVRLGDILVAHGHLTTRQRDAILVEQRLSARPFGLLAEQMFGVSPVAVEHAWAEQYALGAPRVDPRRVQVDAYALTYVSKRQAWQFGVLPIGFDGDELVVCTTQENLVRALRFVGWRIGHETHFVTAEAEALGEALSRHYPMGGMSPGMVA
jgi:hypothetical protein